MSVAGPLTDNPLGLAAAVLRHCAGLGAKHLVDLPEREVAPGEAALTRLNGLPEVLPDG